MIGLKGLPPTGGGARAGAAVIRRLSRQYEFTVFATASHASDPRPIDGVRQVVLPSLPFHRPNLIFYYWASAATAVLKHDFDLVHVHHGMGGYIVPFLKTRFPTVVTFRGYGPALSRDERFGWLARRTLQLGERLAAQHADELVTVAESHVSYYQSLTDKPTRWIPNGVEPPRVKPLPEGKGDFMTFAAGRIIPLKGCHHLLEAMSEMAREEKLVVMGDLSVDSDHSEKLQNLASDLDVEFTGLIADSSRLHSTIAASKLFIFPSLTEAMSNMLLEVVMCETPLVCSDIPANRSVLNPDEAVFFKAGSTTDLAKKISWALEHPKRVGERAIRAKRRIAREFDWDRIADSYHRLYRRLIESGECGCSRPNARK